MAEGDKNSLIHHFLTECMAFKQSGPRHFLPECVAPQTTRGCHTVERSAIFALIPVGIVSGYVLLELPVKRCEGDRA